MFTKYTNPEVEHLSEILAHHLHDDEEVPDAVCQLDMLIASQARSIANLTERVAQLATKNEEQDNEINSLRAELSDQTEDSHSSVSGLTETIAVLKLDIRKLDESVVNLWQIARRFERQEPGTAEAADARFGEWYDQEPPVAATDE